MVVTLLQECMKHAEYNGPCNETVQCVRDLGPGAICTKWTCTCSDNFYYMKLNLGYNETRNVCELKQGMHIILLYHYQKFINLYWI